MAHTHSELALVSKCHPEAGVVAYLVPGGMLVRLECEECRATRVTRVLRCSQCEAEERREIDPREAEHQQHSWEETQRRLGARP
jgi:hypothetical protein